MSRLNWLIYAVAVLALFTTPAKLGPGRADLLPLIAGEPSAANARTFTSNGVFSPQSAVTLPRGLGYHGSWVGSDAFQGRHDTPWYEARPTFTVMVSGYPALSGNDLEVVFRAADGALTRSRYPHQNTGEAWFPWTLHPPPDAVAFQLRANDQATDLCGWLAFSDPFTVADHISRQLWSFVQLLNAAALVVTLLYGPGFLWLKSRPRSAGDVATAILIGPLLLAGLGVTCWALGGWIAPTTIARSGAAVLLAVLGGVALRQKSQSSLPPFAGRVMAASALLAGFAAAKSNLSVGPEGELFGGTISRTLEVGGHSDSRISYHVVQVIAHHLSPFEDEAGKFFAPWSFVSRGPLAGFIATPLVLATGAHVPVSFPEQLWQPFDREGFAVYRLALIGLGSLLAWAVFGVTAAVTSARWGFVAAIIVLLSPFFVHEMYFSWPKLSAAALVLLAFQRAHRDQPLLAGTMLGTGYLFHPLALLSAPFLALWMLSPPFRQPRCFQEWWLGTKTALRFVAGLAACVGPWQLLGKFAPNGAGQSVFLTYFRLADNQAATWGTWWQSRWDNFANTFLPFYLFTTDPQHESINSIFGPSSRAVHAGFLYWNTLPFALGLPAFFLVIAALVATARRTPAVLLLTVVGPAAALIVYWGAASTGLMRHCGHALFASVIVLGTWGLSQAGPWKQRVLAIFFHPLCFLWRGGEIAVMAFATTFLHQSPDWRGPRGWNDGLSLAFAVFCLGGAVFVLARAVSVRDATSAEPEIPDGFPLR